MIARSSRDLEMAEQEIASFVRRLSRGDDALATLLDHAIGRVLRRAVRATSGPVAYSQSSFHATLFEEPRCAHIRDWLAAAVLNGDTWLENVDSLGRPKKIMKCGSIDALHAEADKRMLREAMKARKVLKDEGEEAVEFSLADGWTVVRMLTPQALDRESSIMQHCIGNGGYDKMLGKDDIKLLSLRDPNGKPHITLEVVGKDIVQLQGKQNSFPKRDYLDAIAPFLASAKLSVKMPWASIFSDINGTIYSEENFPETLEVFGDFIVDSTHMYRDLPKSIKAGGSITLKGVHFESFPERLEAGRNISINDVFKKDFPKEVLAGGSMNFRNSGFTALADGMVVHESLVLAEMKQLKSLPKGLMVRGYLDISESAVTSIPPCARFGSANISSTGIETFDTAGFLPESETDGVHRELIATRSALKSIEGNPWFEVLDLYSSRLSILPENLRVDTKLEISRTSIRSIPPGGVPRDIFMADACTIDSVPDRMDCASVSFWNSKVKLPEKFSCTGTLNLCGAIIRKMPRHLEATHVNLRYVQIETIPERIVAETIDITKSGLDALPPRSAGGFGLKHGVSFESIRWSEGDRLVWSAPASSLQPQC